MLDPEIKRLIEDIEDNLSNYLSDVEKIIDVKDRKITKLAITTNLDKTHDASVVAEDIMNDPDYTIVDVQPVLFVISEETINTLNKKTRDELYKEEEIINADPVLSVIAKDIMNDPYNVIINPHPVLRDIRFKNEVCILPRNALNSLTQKTQITYETINNIKNALITLQYINPDIGNIIIKERLSKKIYLLFRLREKMEISQIIHPQAVQDKKKLLEAIHKLIKEVNALYEPRNTNAYELKVKEAVSSSESRNINTDELKLYFKSTFKGAGNDNENYFAKFVEDIKVNRSAKEFAQIALMCYNGTKMNYKQKPRSFSKWYKKFCNCIDVQYVEGYKPNNLGKINKQTMDIFHYLK